MLFNKIKNYRNFFLEMLAVFIGITASFWLDDYRTNIQEQNLADKYLAGFVADLKKDRTHLDQLIEVRNKQFRSSAALLQSIEDHTLDVDSFYYHYYVLFPFYKFIPNSNTIEEVLNSSHLRLITNDNLKTSILELRNNYTELQQSEEHIYQDRTVYFYSNLTLDNIEFNGLDLSRDKKLFSLSKDFEVYKQDAENFQKARNFKSFLNLLKYNLRYLIPRTQAIRDENASIISLIEAEMREGK